MTVNRQTTRRVDLAGEPAQLIAAAATDIGAHSRELFARRSCAPDPRGGGPEELLSDKDSRWATGHRVSAIRQGVGSGGTGRGWDVGVGCGAWNRSRATVGARRDRSLGTGRTSRSRFSTADALSASTATASGRSTFTRPPTTTGCSVYGTDRTRPRALEQAGLSGDDAGEVLGRAGI
jgi:hypothetical protein